MQDAVPPPPEKPLAQVRLCINRRAAVFTPNIKLTLRVPRATSVAVPAAGDSMQVSVTRSNASEGADKLEVEVLMGEDDNSSSDGEDGLARRNRRQEAGTVTIACTCHHHLRIGLADPRIGLTRYAFSDSDPPCVMSFGSALMSCTSVPLWFPILCGPYPLVSYIRRPHLFTWTFTFLYLYLLYPRFLDPQSENRLEILFHLYSLTPVAALSDSTPTVTPSPWVLMHLASIPWMSLLGQVLTIHHD